MPKKNNNLLIAASGTGGHIFPALAVANQIDKNWNISWLGIRKRCEIQLVPAKYNLITLGIETPRQKNILLLAQYLRIILSSITIIKIIKERKINLVFTTGGYISAPTIIAARLLQIPVIIHESNVIPGTVTKYFGRFCNFVLTGFKETLIYLRSCKTIHTGTPLRDEFYKDNSLPSWVPKGNSPLLLVMGGSQGAQGINTIIQDSIEFLLDNNVRIVHILGDNDFFICKHKNSTNYYQIPFTHEIAGLIQNCDLVISRSGAGCINELIHFRKPSILIPYPYSKNNHQEKNAMILASIGSSIMIKQNEQSKLFLLDCLKRIFNTQAVDSNKYEILELMHKNISNISANNPLADIKKIFDQFSREF
tara:strand:- start:14 stop:1108 length:1095 start_codon:yes stop_codon:yes gene_type:complete